MRIIFMNLTNKREVREHVRNVLQEYVEDGTVDTDEMRALVKSTCDEVSFPVPAVNVSRSTLESLTTFLSTQNVSTGVLQRVRSRLQGLEKSQHEQPHDITFAAETSDTTSSKATTSSSCAQVDTAAVTGKVNVSSASSDFGLSALRERMAKKREELKVARAHAKSSVAESDHHSKPNDGNDNVVASIVRTSANTGRVGDDSILDTTATKNTNQQGTTAAGGTSEDLPIAAVDRVDAGRTTIKSHATCLKNQTSPTQQAPSITLTSVSEKVNDEASEERIAVRMDAALDGGSHPARHDDLRRSREVVDSTDSITVAGESTTASTETRQKRKKKRSEATAQSIILSAGPLMDDELYDDLPPVRQEQNAGYPDGYAEHNAYAPAYYGDPHQHGTYADALPSSSMHWQTYPSDPTMPVTYAQYGADHHSVYYPPQHYYEPNGNQYASY